MIVVSRLLAVVVKLLTDRWCRDGGEEHCNPDNNLLLIYTHIYSDIKLNNNIDSGD